MTNCVSITTSRVAAVFIGVIVIFIMYRVVTFIVKCLSSFVSVQEAELFRCDRRVYVNKITRVS